MKIEISFSKGELDYHATVFIFDDGTYDVTEFYSINEDCDSVDLDWKPFKYEIENQISEYLQPKQEGYFGGYDNFIEGLAKSY